MPAPLLIDVDLGGDYEFGVTRDLCVVVEPAYGVPAVCAALDAGWGSVEVDHEHDGVAPIPLVSFEQPGAADGRCRVRSSDLDAALLTADDDDASAIVLAAPCIARPFASAVAGRARELDVVRFSPAPSHRDCSEPGREFETFAVDAVWASGMLIRMLLEELEGRDAVLTDAAGVSVSLAQGAESAVAQLGSGIRWRRHVAGGGHADDLRIAAAVDSFGIVPEVVVEAGVRVARPWLPHSGS